MTRFLPLRRVLSGAAAFLAAMALAGCVAQASGTGAIQMPKKLVPSGTVDGLNFHEETVAERAFTEVGSAALVVGGKVWSIHQGGNVQGDLQVAAFKPQYSALMPKVRDGVLTSIGAHNFQLTRLGVYKVWVANLPGEILLLWFPADGRYYELMDAQASFQDAENLFVSLLSYQSGGSLSASAGTGVPPIDPRQGGDYS